MRILIVAAHPDDETIGASALLGCRDELCVVHATTGAPRESRWWPAGVTQRAAYARERDREARRALSIVGIEPISLGFEDQGAVFALAELVAAIRRVIARFAPDAIVTHAYEGGHPDHDAVAFATAAARITAAPLLEMATYHGASGALRVGEFLDEEPARALDSAQQQRRRSMILAYRSQRATLAPFLDLTHERYRLAPTYEFTRPPHDGPLHYERLGMRPTSREWCALARSAMAQSSTVGAQVDTPAPTIVCPVFGVVPLMAPVVPSI